MALKFSYLHKNRCRLNGICLMMVGLILLLLAVNSYAYEDDQAYDQIVARIRPEGHVKVANDAAADIVSAKQANNKLPAGQRVYENYCIVCHGVGAAGAPKFGNSQDWQPHIAKGLGVLFGHVKSGFNFMPPRGACTECSDADLKAAMLYMVNHSRTAESK